MSKIDSEQLFQDVSDFLTPGNVIFLFGHIGCGATGFALTTGSYMPEGTKICLLSRIYGYEYVENRFAAGFLQKKIFMYGDGLCTDYTDKNNPKQNEPALDAVKEFIKDKKCTSLFIIQSSSDDHKLLEYVKRTKDDKVKEDNELQCTFENLKKLALELNISISFCVELDYFERKREDFVRLMSEQSIPPELSLVLCLTCRTRDETNKVSSGEVKVVDRNGTVPLEFYFEKGLWTQAEK